MPGQPSNSTSSTLPKASSKTTTGESRDSSSTYSYDPKQENAGSQKASDKEIKRLMQTAYKNSVKMGL